MYIEARYIIIGDVFGVCSSAAVWMSQLRISARANYYGSLHLASAALANAEPPFDLLTMRCHINTSKIHCKTIIAPYETNLNFFTKSACVAQRGLRPFPCWGTHERLLGSRRVKTCSLYGSLARNQ